MDPLRFDALTKALAAAGTRRGLVRLLAALPLGVTLGARRGDGPAATAEDDDHGSSHRHRRRKTRNARRSGDDKDNRNGKRKGKRRDTKKDKGTQPCTTRTCAPGVCGSQPDGCGGTLTCGGCAGNTICD